MGLIITLVVLLLLAFFVMAVYNSLVSAKLKVKNAWAQIETQLKRRFDLIPNLIETVKGYAKHEEGTFQKVIEARNSFNSASNVEETAKATNELSSTLKSIFALAESYPDLKANTNFLDLQQQLSETENKIAFARQFYNDTVQMYNEKILVFPNNIIASIFKYTEEEFFKTTEEEKENIKVQF
ncbi:MAG: LemA family protein [Clostridia bacterium]